MSDYKEKFEEWQKTAKEKIEEIDEQFRLKEKLEGGAKVLIDTAQKGAETLREGVDRLKSEAKKSEVGKQAVKIAEEVVKTASETAKTAWEMSEPVRQMAEEASEKASEVLETAAEKVENAFDKTKERIEKATHRISKTIEHGTSWTQTFDITVKTLKKTTEWIKESPFNAALTGISVIFGAGLGTGLTLASSYWFFNSALPVWSIKKISEKFMKHIEEQEELVKKGEISEAEKERIEFEREIVKHVGAPLLAAFSFSSGAIMWATIFSPRGITGAPISWILRGNPVLEGVWLFGNGLACFKIGYEFFLIALKDQKETENLIRQIKGLIPDAG